MSNLKVHLGRGLAIHTHDPQPVIKPRLADKHTDKHTDSPRLARRHETVAGGAEIAHMLPSKKKVRGAILIFKWQIGELLVNLMAQQVRPYTSYNYLRLLGFFLLRLGSVPRCTTQNNEKNKKQDANAKAYLHYDMLCKVQAKRQYKLSLLGHLLII